MKITQENIVSYINFLFKKNNNIDAPEEIINSWRTLNNEEIQAHLKNLYQHWSLSPDKASALEQEFSSTLQPSPSLYDIPQPQVVATPTPPPVAQAPPAYTAPQQPNPIQTSPIAQKKSPVVPILLVVLGLGIAGFAGYYFAQKDKVDPNATTVVPSNTATTPTTSIGTVVEPPKTVETLTTTTAPIATATAEPVTEVHLSDERNAAVIEKLFEAEYRQDFYNIYKSFSKNMEKYWSVNYPTEAELKSLYEKTWSKRTNIKHDNVSIEKVGPNTYNVNAVYSAYDVDKGETVQRAVKTRFEFDSENKIIKTYGL